MEAKENGLDKELFLEKFEHLSLKIEQLTDEITSMKNKMDKSNKINRTFGLKALRNSEPLNFAQDVPGISSPTKRYLLSIRAISEEWKGRKNDILLTIRQQEKETHTDLKALGIRIPIKNVRALSALTKEIISLLFVAAELKGLEINDILREMLTDINKNSTKMLQELKKKMLV